MLKYIEIETLRPCIKQRNTCTVLKILFHKRFLDLNIRLQMNINTIYSQGKEGEFSCIVLQF